MPQKAQLLLQLAQAAARAEGRQQAALPQVAVNVWESLTGSQVHAQQASWTPQSDSVPRASPAVPGNDRLAGLNLLNISKAVGQQAGYTGSAWVQHPHLTPNSSGDTAAIHDTSCQQPLLHTPVLPTGLLGGSLTNLGLARQAGPGPSSLSSTAEPVGASVLAVARKPRLNNSISLNKQIMNTHSMRELHNIVRSKGAGFDFFNISSAIARVPKLVGPLGGVQNDATAKALVDDLAGLMATHINTFDARGLANSAWAFGKMKYCPNQKFPALIAAAAIDRMGAFSAQNLSNLLWSFVYLHYRDEQLLKAIAQQVVQKVQEFKPQELANVVWAFASMEHLNPELMNVVGQRALLMRDQFKEQELSNVVWAFAKLHHYDERLFTHLLDAVDAKLPHFLPQGVSNVAWALATAGHRDEGLFQRLLVHCLSDINSYDVQGLSNLLWACATLGHRDEAFLSAVLQECSCRIERMSSQNLSNALWACATLGYADPGMLSSWAEVVMHKLEMFEPQGLSNTAWAFAKLGCNHPVLFESMAAAAQGKLDMFTAQGISNMAWAYATVGLYNAAFTHRLAEQVAKLAGTFNPQNCSVTAWAFSTLRHYHPELFDILLEQLASQLRDVEPQNIANFLWAFARVGHPLGQHTEALVSAAKQLLPHMNQQELCNTVWSLGVLGQLDVHTWEQFCHCVGSVQGLTPEGVHQAFHAQLMLHCQIARTAGIPLASIPAEQVPTLPEPLHSTARNMWLASALDVHVSKLQADVSNALLAAGIPNSMEWLTDDGLFSIDIAFQVDGQPIAVEVDGSHHYTNSVPQLPLSEVLVRRRLLQDRGWKVLNIGYMDWELLPDSTKPAALLQLITHELGPSSSWQQVCQPTLGSPAAAVPAGGWGVRNTAVTSNAAGLSNWGTAGSLDAEVAAAAAAAVAAAVGGNAAGSVVRNGSMWGNRGMQQQRLGVGYGQLGFSPYGAGFVNESMLGGLAANVPAAAAALDSYNYRMDAALWGGNGLGTLTSSWSTAECGSRLSGLQQQHALEALLGVTPASVRAAAQRQAQSEYLAVGGPTMASSSNSSSSSKHAGVPDNRDAATNPPASSNAGSSCGKPVEEDSSRMAAFMWGDNLGIWGPLGFTCQS